MNKIPTAEEFIKEHWKDNLPSKASSIPSWLANFCIDYAKLHVQAALEAAAEYVPDKGQATIDKPTILNAYPLENIK